MTEKPKIFIIDHMNLINGVLPQKNKDAVKEVLSYLTKLRRKKKS